MSSLKLNLGSGDSKLPGFLSVDLYDKKADVTADICEPLPFEDGSVEEIVCNQVIEHLPYWKTDASLESRFNNVQPTDQFWLECYRVLEPGGTMITECPNIEYVAQRIVASGDVDYDSMISIYGEYYRPWDRERYDDWEHCAAGLHISAFTWKRIQRIAARVGFAVKLYRTDDPYNLSVLWTKPAS